MGRETKRLTARTAATLTKPGRHADGGNLYLSISANGGRRWIFLYRWGGRQLEMGLGSARDVSLARARALADAARAQIAEGVDPLAARKVEQVVIPTFGVFADELVSDIREGFRNEKHRWQWKHTLEVYAASLRSIQIDAVTTEDVLAVLKPLWQTKQETASRLRGRIERVLDAAKARSLRSGENPARWRGHLDALLPKRQKLQRGHHPAMPYEEVPAFLAELRKREAIAALALEFTILTAARTGEVLGATWVEIDRKAKLWTVPAGRMKAGKEHRVPLTGRALEILDLVEKVRGEGDFLFPGPRKGKPFSNMAMSMLLRTRMKRPEVTVHGFRSSFRDWAGECTSFPREVAEAALAHVIGDEVERAYRRGDALEKRRKLMEAWGKFVTGTVAAKVIPLAAVPGGGRSNRGSSK